MHGDRKRIIRWSRSALAAALAATGITACASTTSPRATVSFAIDAPLCSSVLPVEFSIDGQRVGTDTFRVAVSNAHTTSRAFSVSPGRHLLGAHVINGFVWPDSSVAVSAGTAVYFSLPFYCS